MVSPSHNHSVAIPRPGYVLSAIALELDANVVLEEFGRTLEEWCRQSNCTFNALKKDKKENGSRLWHLHSPQLAEIEGKLAEWKDRWSINLNLCNDQVCREIEEKGALFVFDLDSTLIQMEVIDEIARLANVYDRVAEITRLATQGKIDFGESLRRRVSLLRDLPVEHTWRHIIERIQFTRGVERLASWLRANPRIITAVISGGFLPVAEYVRAKLGFTYCFANEMVTLEGVDGIEGRNAFAGLVKDPIVDVEGKRDLMLQLAQKHNIPRQRIVAVGDGANDLAMLRTAGYGIAFCAKPLVQQETRIQLNVPNLALLLDILGIGE